MTFQTTAMTQVRVYQLCFPRGWTLSATAFVFGRVGIHAIRNLTGLPTEGWKVKRYTVLGVEQYASERGPKAKAAER